MRVLMIGPDRSVHGGISAVVNSYFDAGLGEKVQLNYIGTMQEGSKIKKLLIAACAYLKFLFSLHNTDIVHIHVASDNSFRRKSLFIRAADKERAKRKRKSDDPLHIVIHQHGGDFINYHDHQVKAGTRMRMDNILNMADTLVVLTSSWKDYFGNIVAADKIRVIPNGINVPERTDVPHDMKHILYLGRICAEKGVRELTEAVIDLHESDPDIELYLGGIYETKQAADIELKSLTRSHPDYIHCLGWVDGDEKDALLNSCGICVLPSYFEGFGLVLIEAMSHDCVTIGTRVGGIPEIITDGETGLLIEPGNKAQIIDAIRRIINEPGLSNRVRDNAYQLVSEKYSLDTVIKQILELYSYLLAKTD